MDYAEFVLLLVEYVEQALLMFAEMASEVIVELGKDLVGLMAGFLRLVANDLWK